MRNVILSILSVSIILAVNSVSAEHLPANNNIQPVKEDIATRVVNVFGVIYSISNTVVRQTQKLKYLGRDKFDQLVYDVKVYDIDHRIDKHPGLYQ